MSGMFKNQWLNCLHEGAKYAVIHKLIPERPEDPDVHMIDGGVYRLSRLRKEITDHLDDYSRRAKKGDFSGLFNEFTATHANMKNKILGLIEVEQQLKDPKIKRKITQLKKKR